MITLAAMHMLMSFARPCTIRVPSVTTISPRQVACTRYVSVNGY